MTLRASAAFVTALSISAVGCASGGGPGPEISPGAGPTVLDSSRTDAVNRRILSAAAFDTGDEGSVPTGYEIGPGDVVEIDVFNVEEFSGSFPVDETGEISIPLLSPIEAAGHTVRELEEVLETRLRETYVRDPRVTIRIGEMGSHGVSVMGAVRRPGVYQITGRRTLLEVLAMAEGLTEEAGNSVLLVRPGAAQRGARVASASDDPISMSDSSVAITASMEQVVEIDLGALLESGRTEENIVVRPGDIVQVRPADFVYVVGEVNRPGGFPVPPGEPMTVLQALAMAQGLGSTAAAGRTVIVRERADGSREEIPVDLGDVLSGSAPSPTLVGRDVLFVPKNGAKSFALGAIDALVRMVTFRGLVY